MFYAEIKNNKLIQIYGISDTGSLANMEEANPDSVFVMTNEFGGASEFYFDGTEIVKKPPKTDQFSVWDDATWKWFDPRTLDQLKAEKWAEIKAMREALLTSPLTTPFGVFDATPDAQKSITDAVLMLQTLASLGTPQTIDFTLADNTTVTLTAMEMVQVGLLLGQRTQIAYSQSRALRAEIEAATSKAELELINWS